MACLADRQPHPGGLRRVRPATTNGFRSLALSAGGDLSLSSTTRWNPILLTDFRFGEILATVLNSATHSEARLRRDAWAKSFASHDTTVERKLTGSSSSSATYLGQLRVNFVIRIMVGFPVHISSWSVRNSNTGGPCLSTFIARKVLKYEVKRFRDYSVH